MNQKLHINDLFWTVQGEGLHSGTRALFVRMPFCNLACEWCDTTFNSFKEWDEEAFKAFADCAPQMNRFAVVTGGEPLLHKHTERVIEILKKLRFTIACESNGTPNSDRYELFDFVTISPKRQTADKGMEPYKVSEAAMKAAHEFKYVVDDQFDFSILDRHDVYDGRRYSLSPEFNKFDESVKKILDFIERNPAWKISLQTHKWIKVA